MKPLIILPQGEADIDDVALFIGTGDPERALTFADELYRRALQVAKAPQLFPRRDEISKGIRSARHGAYPLFFRETDDDVRLVRVLHAARDLSQVFRT